MLLQRFSIRVRLRLFFAAVVGLMLFGSALALWHFRNVRSQAARASLIEHRMSAMLRLNSNLVTLMSQLHRAADHHDPARFEAEARLLLKAFQEKSTTTMPAVQGIAEESSRHAILAGSIRDTVESLPARISSLVELARGGDWIALHARLLNQADRTDDVLALLMTQVDADLVSARKLLKEDLETAQNRAVNTLAIAAALSLAAAALLGAVVTRSITRPLAELEAGAQALAKGAFAHRIPLRGNDELAQLAVAFNRAAADLTYLFEEVENQRASAEAAHFALKERARELTRVNSDLEQFAYSASHDLQEPLRTVVVYGQLFQKRYAGQFDDRGNEYINGFVNAALHMSQLLNDLLAYTRTASLDNGATAVTDTNAILRRVLNSLESQIAEQRCAIHADSLPNVSAHEVHVQQLLQNLLGNAIKYRGDSDPVLRIWAERRDDLWMFAVRDNGIGVPPDYAKRIFGIFKRLHGAKYEGTGIGLAICQRIVQIYGGEIWVEPNEDRGSTFRFTLPGA